MKDKHTPGPWRLMTHKYPSGRVYVYTNHGSDWLFDQDDNPIIHFHQADYDSEACYDFTDEDAFLIAAAPDLLDACEATLDVLVARQDYSEPRINAAIISLRAAIARAKGEDR